MTNLCVGLFLLFAVIQLFSVLCSYSMWLKFQVFLTISSVAMDPDVQLGVYIQIHVLRFSLHLICAHGSEFSS
jgi:hypothetical protein